VRPANPLAVHKRPPEPREFGRRNRSWVDETRVVCHGFSGGGSRLGDLHMAMSAPTRDPSGGHARKRKAHGESDRFTSNDFPEVGLPQPRQDGNNPLGLKWDGNMLAPRLDNLEGKSDGSAARSCGKKIVRMVAVRHPKLPSHQWSCQSSSAQFLPFCKRCARSWMGSPSTFESPRCYFRR